MSINKLGAGARWRRTTGQEIYSPLLLAFTHEVMSRLWLLTCGLIIFITMFHLLIDLIYQNLENWKSSHFTQGTAMDPNYSLPPNVALITLEVASLHHRISTIAF